MQRNLRQLGALHNQNVLLASLDDIHEGCAKLGTKSREEFVLERSLQHHRWFWRRRSRGFRRSRRRACARGLCCGSRDGGCAACGLFAWRHLGRIWFLRLVSHGPWVRWAALNSLPFLSRSRESSQKLDRRVSNTRWKASQSEQPANGMARIGDEGDLRLTPTQVPPFSTAISTR